MVLKAEWFPLGLMETALVVSRLQRMVVTFPLRRPEHSGFLHACSPFLRRGQQTRQLTRDILRLQEGSERIGQDACELLGGSWMFISIDVIQSAIEFFRTPTLRRLFS